MGWPSDPAGARAAAEGALDSGAAAERFGAMVAELGGPADLIENPDAHLRSAPVVRAVEAPEAGTVTTVDVRAVGIAVVAWAAAGPARPTPSTTASASPRWRRSGERVGPGERPLALVHARDEGAAERAAGALRQAFRLGEGPAASMAIVREVLR